MYFSNELVADVFRILIFGDDGGGLPDTGSNPQLNLVAGDVDQVATGDHVAGSFDLYEYWLDIDPLTLTAGETYYLMIVNFTGEWYWASSSHRVGTHLFDGLPLDGIFESVEGELAFNLTNDGVVPEPASVVLMGLGLGAIAWRTRRKRS